MHSLSETGSKGKDRKDIPGVITVGLCLWCAILCWKKNFLGTFTNKLSIQIWLHSHYIDLFLKMRWMQLTFITVCAILRTPTLPSAAQSSTIFVAQSLLEWTEGIDKQEETLNYWRETEYLNCQASCNNGKSAFAHPILIWQEKLHYWIISQSLFHMI